MNFHHPATTTLMGVVILFTTLTAADAKRGPAPPVNTVVIGSIAYSAPPDPDDMGYVIATDVPSGKELWRQRIYRVFLNPFVETDVQWVFITLLVRQDHTLLVTNERGERFTLDLKTRKATKRK
jgi:hypothetical protein